METYYFDYITSFGLLKDVIGIKQVEDGLRILVLTNDFSAEASLTLETIQKEIEKIGLTQIERDNLVPTLISSIKENNFTIESLKISFHFNFGSSIKFSLSFPLSTPIEHPYTLKRLVLEYSTDPALLSKKREASSNSPLKTNKCLVNPRMRKEKKTKGIRK